MNHRHTHTHIQREGQRQKDRQRNGDRERKRGRFKVTRALKKKSHKDHKSTYRNMRRLSVRVLVLRE